MNKFKQIAAVCVLTLTLTGCVSPAKATPIVVTPAINKINKVSQLDLMTKVSLGMNTQKLQKMVSHVRKYVGKTWYVFSGASPSGWDCSGLTMWAYEQIGIPLEHRASKQQNAGNKTVKPKIGDLVIFTYKGYKSAYHVGLYVGNGLMIHAPKKGEVTRVESISIFAGKWSEVSYRTILNSL